MSFGLADKPLALFLKSHLQGFTSLLAEATLSQALVAELREKLHAALYDETIDLRFRPFLLQSCALIPHLGKDTLSHYLRVHALPDAQFLSEPAARFDSALVPLQSETSGSGYVLYLTDDLTSPEVYELLAHAYGHLAFGHLRRGDIHSHYDLLNDLRTASGPPRRWDRAIQAQQHLWFQPLSHGLDALVEMEYAWSIPGFAEAFAHLQRGESDDSSLPLQAFAARHGNELIQVDFDLERDAQLFPHQKRGAAELVVRLQKLGVALLADSVGLGKTRTVATTIKLLCQAHIITRAAILAPAKLHHNWLAELQKLNLTVSTHEGSQSEVLLLNKDIFKRQEARAARKMVQSCQLLVIEEAHQDLRNFDNKFHRNVREAALDTYGLLVTATPWNNRRGDIFAMLQPFAANRKGTDRPAHFFACFAKGLEAGQQEFEQDTHLFQHIYNCTTLQRTRRQLRQSGDTSVFYAPRRPYLISVDYTPEQRHSFATLLEKIEQLRLPAYNPIRHVTAANSSESGLSGIYRFQLLKRAESSMYAFSLSLQKLGTKAQAILQALSAVAESESAVAAWLEQWYELEEQEDQHPSEPGPLVVEPKPSPGKHARTRKLIDKAKKEGRLRALRVLLLDNCQHDIHLIQTIQGEFASLFTKDPKFDMVMQKIQESAAKGQKVLCISQFADTAYAVYHAVMADPLLAQGGVGFLTSSEKEAYAAAQINGLAAPRDAILSRFAPQSWSPGTKRKADPLEQRYPSNIAILIGSDTLSVGQNLQDARILLNLDLCWNPMQHEQRIGRIDRPRHKDDSEPLDIYYFLNLDLIEAELALHKTLEERLTSTYRDTSFDDEIFPGYFEMIEQFSRLRNEKQSDVTYIAEADALLEELAERSARPLADGIAEDERERAVLQRLRDVARGYTTAENLDLDQQLVSIGQLPYYDWQGSPYLTRPSMALVAEVRFQTLDQHKRVVGKAIYQHISISLNEEGVAPNIVLNDVSLIPVAEGFMADAFHMHLKRKHVTGLHGMLTKLEAHIQQTIAGQKALLKRQQRYQRQASAEEEDRKDTFTQVIEAYLVNIRLLV